MDQDQDWSCTKLDHYLLLDNWEEYPAWCLLVGLDYSQERMETLDSGFFLAVDDETYKAIIADMANKVDRLRDYSQSADKAIASYAPRSFINWALSKRIRPPWLDWAIQENLYTPEQEASQNKTGTVTLTTTYSTKWLEIQQAAILEFFSPRREVDAMKEDVVPWIVLKAKMAGIRNPTNVAKVMFTIIKPEDHNPKIRRAGPIKTQQP